ncbi:MAG: metal-dependent transcriptional regulator [Candidatus Electryonea clarkiae]|nr:metal-dependent transcriptional regulator [Candidatus Electryonea clarkiae]MDP8285903.1 metal-dependent transcriptional regulator [Candidatus Electryonea clarkiae]
MRKTKKISSSAEEYLLTLFRLEFEGTRAGTSYLAKVFGVKPPSVTGMLRRLNLRGWINYKRYRPSSLTAAGREIAVRLIRRHRLLETFLVEFLEYKLEDVHDAVQSLEHAVTDDLMKRIDSKLVHPAFDPHGDPIPDENGSMPEMHYIPLTKLKVGQIATLRRIDNRDRKLLGDLLKVGAHPGVKITKTKDADNGTIGAKIDSKDIKLDSSLAALLWVAPKEKKGRKTQ